MAGTPLSTREAIPLYALLMALTAMSMDLFLPAFPFFEQYYGVTSPQMIHLIIPMLILGMVFGEIFFGLFSDSQGRKRSLKLGLCLYILASLYAFWAPTIEHLLVARFLQGVAVAGPKIATRAMIRDQFNGADMARILSLIMIILIFFPMIAPAVGQGLIYLLGWQSLFLFLILLAIIGFIWMSLRQSETLAPADRLSFTWPHFIHNLGRILSHPNVLAYTIAVGLVFGAILGYLSLAADIFQKQYHTGEWFPLYFAILATAIIGANYFNSRYVHRFGMSAIVIGSLISFAILSGLSLGLFSVWSFTPPFALFMVSFYLIFFCIGLLFGNLNALAMTYLGKIAGLGSSVNSALSSLVAFVIAYLLTSFYDQTLFGLLVGYCLLACTALALSLFAKEKISGPVIPVN